MALVAVDLDGVCYEWQRTARYMLREYRGYDRSGPMGQEIETWDYIEDNVRREDWRWLWSDGVRLGLFRYGHMVAGSRLGLETLREFGYKLTLVTHRPEDAVNDTLDWITLYFKDIPLSGLSIISDGSPKTSVPWDILIDDKKENIEDAVKAGRTGILFDRGHDQFDPLFVPEGAIRCTGWTSTVEALRELRDA